MLEVILIRVKSIFKILIADYRQITQEHNIEINFHYRDRSPAG